MITLSNLHASEGTIMTCPCGKTTSLDLERIPRGFIARSLSFFVPMKKYKCYKCNKKKLIID